MQSTIFSGLIICKGYITYSIITLYTFIHHTLFSIKHTKTQWNSYYYVYFIDEATEHLNHYNCCHQHSFYKNICFEPSLQVLG